MALTFRHPFVNAHVDGSDATLAQPSNWNADHVIAGGTKGALLVFDATQTIGINSVAAVAVGQVLVSAGTTTLPLWSTSPTLTSVTAPAATNLSLGAGGSSYWQIDASGPLFPIADNSRNFGGAANRIATGYFGTALAMGTNPATVGAARFPNGGTGTTYWRNATNTADVFGIYVDNANKVNVGDSSSVGTILGSPSVVFSSVGPHGIGGGTSSLSQLYFAGSFAERYGPYINTTLNPPVNTDSAGFVVNPVFTEFSSGTHSLLASHRIEIATVTAGAAVVTNTASLYVAGAMSATVTGKNYAAWIAGGLTRLDGGVQLTAVAFASVPASPAEGTLIGVTDSTTAVWGATITGGGANHVLAYYNGSNWTVAGK